MNSSLTWFVLFQTYYPHLALLALWFVKSTGMVLLGWSVALLLRRRSAAARCWVWRAVLIGLIALAAFEFGPAALQKLRWRAKVEMHRETAQQFWADSVKWNLVRPPSELQELYEQRREARRRDTSVPPWERDRAVVVENSLSEARSRVGHRVESLAFRIWGAGAAFIAGVVLLRTMAGLFWLKRNSQPVSGPAESIVARVGESLNLKRPGRVRLSPLIQSPLLTGWWRPLIHLPTAAREWSEAQLVSAFLHELAHWRRRDPHWKLAGRLLTAFVWWNPLVRLATRQMNEESEEAADDVVVLRQGEAGDYARLLVSVASLPPAGVVGATGISMTGHRSLERRLRALLAANPWRGRIGAGALTIIGGLLAITLGGASLLVANRSQAATQTARKAELNSGLTGEQRSTLEQIVERNTRRMTALRCLHLTEECWMSEEREQTVLKAPQPSKSEVWVDHWTGRHRANFRPAVNRWIDGAAPFYIKDRTELNDGTHSYSWSEERDLETLEGSPPRELAHHLNIREIMDMVQVARSMLTTSTLEREEMIYTMANIDWQGKPAVQIQQQFFRDGAVSQEKTFVIDVSNHDMLCFSELVFPQSKEGTRLQNTVLETATATNGELFPRRYTRHSHSNNVRTVTEYTVTRLEVLSELPAGITSLPAPASARFLAKNAPPVRYAMLTVRYQEAGTDKPLAGVSVSGKINRQDIQAAKSDVDGRVNIPLPNEEITYLNVKARTEGFVPQTATWRKQGDALQFPEMYEVELHRGSPISGRVVNEEGEPVAGAKLEFGISGDGTQTFSDGFALWGTTATSDANGRWSLPNFPPKLTGLLLRVSCVGYRASTDHGTGSFETATGQRVDSLRDGSSVITLKRGAVLKGRITSEDGRAIGAGRLTIGKDIHGSNPPVAQSNANGEFTLPGLAAGPHWLTVEARGYKPQALEVTLPMAAPLALKLASGRIVRGRVTMPDGQPSAGLNVGVDGWKKLRTLTFSTRTDAKGRFEWTGAPDEPVEFVFGAGQSREFLCGLELQPADHEQVITMKPALQINGKVLDAKTGKAVERFRLVPGMVFESEKAHWQRDAAVGCTGGQFDWKDNYIRGRRTFLIEAEGYRPLQTKTFATTQVAADDTYRLEPAQ